MPNKPHFYIVTPSFNQAKFLKQTLDSVTSQSGTNKTQIIMDGGSTDGTVQILKIYTSKHFYWVSKKDKGQSDALNKGLTKVSEFHPKPTDIVAYINSDDYYLSDAFATVTNTFQNNPNYEWLVGDAVIVNDDNKEIQGAIRVYKKIWRKLLSVSLLAVLNPIPQPAVFLKWSVFNKIGTFNQELNFTMDYEYWLRLYQTVGKPLVIPQTLAAFRIHGTSKGGRQFDKQFAEELEVASQFTHNPAILFLHKLHNSLIILIYSLIK